MERWAFRDRLRYAGAVVSEVGSPLLRGYARLRASDAPTPPSAWRRLVILGSAHIGDVLYRTPSLPPLRAALPGCHIAYVCSPLTAELLATNPNVDEPLPVIDDDEGWRVSRSVRARLAAGAFDAALCTDHVGTYRDLSLAVALGIPNRVGLTHKGFSGFATIAVHPACPAPAPAFFREMVARLAGLAPTWSLTPQLTLTADDRAEGAAAWRELAIPAGRTVVACAITSRQPDPTWPARSFVRSLEMLGESLDLDVVLCGSASDGPQLEALAAESTARCHVLGGRLGLRALAAFFTHCTAFLGTDSGPRHIANAVGTPVVFIRRLAISRAEVGVYCDNETDVSPDVEWLSRAEQTRALARLEPATVAAALHRVLSTRAGVGRTPATTRPTPLATADHAP